MFRSNGQEDPVLRKPHFQLAAFNPFSDRRWQDAVSGRTRGLNRTGAVLCRYDPGKGREPCAIGGDCSLAVGPEPDGAMSGPGLAAAVAGFVDLEGVVGQDAESLLSERGGERGFAASGRPHEHECARLGLDGAGVEDEFALSAEGQGEDLVEIEMLDGGQGRARDGVASDRCAVGGQLEIGHAGEPGDVMMSAKIKIRPWGAVGSRPEMEGRAVERRLGTRI